MVSEEFVTFIPKDDRLANSRDANPLETIWILVRQHTKIEKKKNSGRGKTATTLRLEKCEFRHALLAGTFYTSPIRDIAIFAKIASLQGATFGIQFKSPAAGDFSPVSPFSPLHAFLDISDRLENVRDHEGRHSGY